MVVQKIEIDMSTRMAEMIEMIERNHKIIEFL